MQPFPQISEKNGGYATIYPYNADYNRQNKGK